MSQISIEFACLVDCLRWHFDKGPASHHSDSFQTNAIDEKALLKLASAHNLIAWLWPYLKQTNQGSVKFRDELAKRLRFESLLGQRQTRNLLDISKSLTNAEIPHLIFKGVSIEKMFYRGFVESRYSDDIDILIKPQFLAETSHSLAQHGFELIDDINLVKLSKLLKQAPQLYRWRDIGFRKGEQRRSNIDLHWHIADKFTFPASTSELIDNNVMLDVEGQQLACLSFPVLFVYVCVHAYVDFFFRLRYLVDVYAATQQADFDLDEILLLAKHWGVEDKVSASITTANLFFSSDSSATAKDPSTSEFSNVVHERYKQFNGIPPRSHPNKGTWTREDKRKHLTMQIKNRSAGASALAPAFARFHYDEGMVNTWPSNVSAHLWRPFALIKRFIR